ncbi:MAG: hypothetical protein R3F11_10385 [Verrucomicrobiales bacterium]
MKHRLALALALIASAWLSAAPAIAQDPAPPPAAAADVPDAPPPTDAAAAAAAGDAEPAPAPIAPGPEPAPAPAPEAEPPAENPGGSEAEIPEPKVERSIYLPYDDLKKVFENDGRGVFLPYREFLDLWNQLTIEKEKDKMQPPTDGGIAFAEYSAKVEGEALIITAKLKAESFKDEGWARVPLAQPGLSIAEAQTGDAVLNRADQGYELLLPKKGVYDITLQLYTRIAESAGRFSTTLSLPRVAVSKFDATIPGEGWDFTLNPAAAYTARKDGAGNTELSFFVGEADRVELSWQKGSGETELTPLIFADADLEVLAAPGALQSALTVNYRILRAGVDVFTIAVPKPHEVLSVEGANIKEWAIEDGGEAQNLKVTLHAKAEKQYSLKVQLEAGIEGLPAEIAAPSPAIGDAARQRGSVALRASRELEAELKDLQGLAQQAASSNGDGNAALLGQFRYLKAPFGVTLALKKAEPEIEVNSFAIASVEPDIAKLAVRFEYKIKRAGIFSTRIGLPAGFESIEAQGDAVEDFDVEETEEGDNNARTLVVRFKGETQGDTAFTVTGRQLRETPEEELPAPVFTPEGAERHEGKVGYALHSSLDPVTNIGGMRQEDVGQLRGQLPAAEGNTVLRLGFRYRGEGIAPASVTFKLKDPQVTAEVHTLIEVKEQAIRYTWWINFNILYAEIDGFTLKLPAVIGNDLRVLDDFVKETDKEFQPELDPAEADGLARYWKLSFRDRKMGTHQTKLTLETPMENVEAGKATQVRMPDISVHGIFQETGQIAVIKDGNLEIIDTEEKNLEVIDPKELRGELASQQGAVLAYKYRRHPLELTLRASKNIFLDVPQALVTYASITAAVAADLGVTAEAIYWVKNNNKQFLSVSLPGGAKIATDIYVDGEPQQPMRRADSDDLLIRLPASADKNRAFPIRFVYTSDSRDPGQKMGFRGSFAIGQAQLLDAEGGEGGASTATKVLQSKLTLHLPQDFYYAFDSAMSQPTEDRGWVGFREGFDDLIPNFGPEPGRGEGIVWSEPPAVPDAQRAGFNFSIPAEGQKVELYRLGAPDGVDVSYRSRGYAFTLQGFAILVAFLAGIYLMRYPAFWRLVYFIAAGLGSLVIAGALTSGSSGFDFWTAIYLGVFLAALVWLARFAWTTVRAMEKKAREMAEKAAKRRAEKKASEPPKGDGGSGPDQGGGGDAPQGEVTA